MRAKPEIPQDAEEIAWPEKLQAETGGAKVQAHGEARADTPKKFLNEFNFQALTLSNSKKINCL